MELQSFFDKFRFCVLLRLKTKSCESFGRFRFRPCQMLEKGVEILDSRLRLETSTGRNDTAR